MKITFDKRTLRPSHRVVHYYFQLVSYQHRNVPYDHEGLDLFAFGDAGQVWGDNRSRSNPLILANDRFAFAIESGAQVRVLMPAVEGRKITVSVDDIIIGSTAPGAPEWRMENGE